MTIEYIIKTCKKYNITNYTINDDLSIDVKGDVYLQLRELTKIPLTFNIVEGDFYCNDNKLTNLKGSPRKCRNFYCHDNELTNLDGSPDECNLFDCYSSNLNNLKGAPKCNYIAFNYKKLYLDNEELYVIEALINRYNSKKLQKYYNIRLKIAKRNELINLILGE